MVKGLYFHIPFCQHKCPYCHFFVLPNDPCFKAQLREGLQLEWEMKKNLIAREKLKSIYFGGGTPTLFASGIRDILSWIKPPEGLEITVEANPETITPSLIAELKEIGINRLSIGIQSLDDSSLQTLDRRHSAERAIESILTAFEGGIDNISIDLMYDIPSQTLASWERTLRHLQNLPITHLSLYNMTIEPHTLFHKKRHQLQLPSDEESLKMHEEAIRTIEELGLKRYEISAFAKPGYASIHNSGYWKGVPFLGFGPSAFSYYEGRRFQNSRNLRKYLKQLEKGEFPEDFSEKLEYPDNLHELLAIQLRLLEGVDLEDFQARWGQFPDHSVDRLQELIREDYIRKQKSHYQLSSKGLLFYDTVATKLI